jgi:hypothetical protein
LDYGALERENVELAPMATVTTGLGKLSQGSKEGRRGENKREMVCS